MMDRLTPSQIRGARAMLGWSMTDLSEAASISVSTVKRVEDAGSATVSTGTVNLIRESFEAAGVQFLPDEGNGPGLRLQPRRPSPFAHP